MEPNSPTNNTGGEARKPSIHTLEGDIFNTMKDDNYANNIVKVVTNPKTNTNKSVSGTEHSNAGKGALIRIVIIVTITLLVGTGLLAYLYINKQNTAISNSSNISNNPATTTLTTTTASTLAAEALIQLNLKELSKFAGIEKVRKIQQDLRDKQIAAGTTVELGLGLTASEFFAKNRFSGDEGLIRALDEQYSFGIYNNSNNVFESFLVFKVKSVDLAFSNMLLWERYLPNDLSDIFLDTSINTAQKEDSSSTGATSTVVDTIATTIPISYIAGFSDKIIRNTDTRIHTDEQNKVRFVYGFINKDYLVIAGGVESFINLKTRLLNDITLR